MARTIGRSMAALVATERHLWLNLLGIRDKERTFLLDTVIPFGLLLMRPFQWWLKKKGFYPLLKPMLIVRVTRRAFRALYSWRSHCFLALGPSLWAYYYRNIITTDASLTGSRFLGGPHFTWQ